MATLIKSYNICGRCNGTKVITKTDEEGNIVEIPCQGCNAVGYFEEGTLDITDLQEDITKCLHRLKKIMDKLDIKD